MRRVLSTMLFAGALMIGARGMLAQGDGGYKLVPNWPKLPAGMYFGLKDAPPPPAERDAQAAARRARGGSGGGQTTQSGGPAKPPRSPRPPIGQKDHISLFKRGVQPVVTFDPDRDPLSAG